MYRKFITFIVASAIAVTGLTAQPVQAGNDDVAKWIAGLAALAIIGAAVADNNRSKSKPVYSHAPQPTYNHVPKPRHSHLLLPAQCRVSENVHGQKIRGFSRHCLRRNNINVQNLPRDCAVKLRDRQGKNKIIYGGRCLQGHGYKLARN
jgi:hypothetical protein